jgi:glycosyltransferase involved in cell wall biosynthesis
VLLKMSRVEGFFGPPLEMMACGGTAVVAKVTGYDEYIVDGQNALVVEPGDIAGARFAIHQLIEAPGMRQRLVKEGLITAARWRWTPTIDVLASAFRGAFP